MKKGTKLAALLLGLALVIPACNINNSSKAPDQSSGDPASEVTPSSEQGGQGSSEQINYTVTISNKEALQAEWFVGDQSRKVELNIEPKANVAQLVNEGVIQISSSNAQILSITGQMASPVAAGEATITVKCGESQDTVAITLKAKQTVKEKYGVAHEGTEADPFTNEDACKVAKAENYNNEDFYVQGKVASFYHLPGSRTDGAVSFFLEPATAGGEKFEVYKCYKATGSGEASYLTDDDIWVGGIALAHGTFTTYNGQAETTGAKLIKCEGNKPQPRQTLTKTFAEVLAAGAALADGDATWDYYKFQGYVTKVVGNDYYLTATKGEALVSGKSDTAHGARDIYTNAIELYFGSTPPAEELAAILLDGAKVEVTMIVKNYHGTIENGLTLTKDDIALVEAGQPWAVPTIKKTVAEALTVINALEDGKTTEDVYEIEGYITAVTTAWSAQFKNISYTIGDTANAAANAVITVFRSAAAEGTDGSALKAGDKVKVVGNLQKYVKDGTTTPELTSGKTTLLEAGADLPVDVTDVNAASTAKTIAEIRAYKAADTTILAKVTGVAEYKYGDAKYGNFHLADPATGEEITIYGGYTDATFTKTGANFATKTKTTAVTADIVGKMVTVYGTVGAYKEVGQLVDALVVVGDACTANVAASVTVNDAEMGTAALSATSAAYGSDITVTPTPASGYQVAKVEVQRAATKEEVTAVEGVYSFKAQAKNAVTVTFEAVPSATLTKVAAYDFSTGNTSTAGYDSNADGMLERFTANAATGDGLGNIVTAVSDISKAYAGQSGHLEKGMKFGTSSANGTFKLALSKNVCKVVVVAAGWTATDSLTVGDAAAQTPGVAYTEEGAFKTLSFNITASNSVAFTFAKRGYIKSIEFYADESVVPQPEIAQPTGTFFASAEITDAGKTALGTTSSIVPIFIKLGAENAVSVSVNGNNLAATLKSYDKTNGNLVITTTAFGDLSMTYNPENGRLEKLSVVAATGVLKYDAGQSLRGESEVKYWNCDGTTAELQAQFTRRYNNPWTADTGNADRIVKDETNFKSGSGAKVRAWKDGRIALAVNDFNAKFNARNLSFWVYNPGEADISLQAFAYKGTGYSDYIQVFNGKVATAGAWTYISVGFTAADVYAFQIVVPNGTTTQLTFDDICLF